MIRFLKKLFLFCLLSFIVFMAADYCLSKILSRASEANLEIWRDVMEGNASADILLSGDSRVNIDCYPPVIDSITGLRSFSCGVIGHHFTIQRLRYDMYRRYNEKPTLLVQFVDSWFYDSMAKYDRHQFFPWMWNVHFLKEILWLAPAQSSKMLVPWFRYHGMSVMNLHWSKRKTSRGFLNYSKTWPFSDFPLMGRIFKPKPRHESLFRSYISEVTAEGIRMVLVIAPVYGARDLPEDEYGVARNHFKDIAEEYRIPFLDYSDTYFSDDRSLFIDAVHLNKRGAKVFSDSLANDIIELGLI